MLDDMLPLEAGCGADGVSARFNVMQRDINPYLEEPKSNKSLCTFLLPRSNAGWVFVGCKRV